MRSVLGQLAGCNLILIGVVFFTSKITEIAAIYQKTLDGYGPYHSQVLSLLALLVQKYKY